LCHFFPGAAVTGLLTSLRGRIIIAITLVHAVLMSLFVFDLVSRQRAFLHREQIERTLSLISGAGADQYLMGAGQRCLRPSGAAARGLGLSRPRYAHGG